MSEEARVFERDARRKAVAELLRVSHAVNADATIIIVEDVGLVAVACRIEEVEKRRSLAEGPSAELDEGPQQIEVAVGVWRASRNSSAAPGRNRCARKAQRRVVVTGVLPAGQDIRAQGAILSLLPCIERHGGTHARDHLVAAAEELRVGTVEKRRERAASVVVHL